MKIRKQIILSLVAILFNLAVINIDGRNMVYAASTPANTISYWKQFEILPSEVRVL